MAKKSENYLTNEEIQTYDIDIRARINSKIGDLTTLRNLCDLTKNTGENMRRGNIVTDVLRVMKARLFSNPLNPKVQSYNPDYQNNAQEVEVVANAVIGAADLLEKLYEASTNAAWATVGWLYITHPMEPTNLDITKTAFLNRTANMPEAKDSSGVDDYVEASPEDIPYAMAGGELDEFDFINEKLPEKEQEPEPAFDATNGYPYIEVVDPRYIITSNSKASTTDDCDYIVRLRPMTIAEVALLTGKQLPANCAGATMYNSLLEDVEDLNATLYQDMVILVECWIQRNRWNPKKSNWHLVYVLGHEGSNNTILYNQPNPNGSMIPFVSLTLDKIKRFGDSSLAKELQPFADTYDVGIQAIDASVRDNANRKILAPKNNQLSDKDSKNLSDPNFRGVVQVTDPNSIVPWKPTTIDQMFVYTVAMIKNIAQTSNGLSDIDKGMAIKDITARQTQALLDSTSVSISGMRKQIRLAGLKAFMKMMFYAGRFSYIHRSEAYAVGSKIVSITAGTHDFTTSLLYDIDLIDTEEVAPEKILAMNQLIKTIAGDQALRAKFNDDELAKFIVNTLRINPIILLSRTPINQGSAPQNQNTGALPSPMLEGEHPERQIGDRGIGSQTMTNAMTGGLR